ncbi:glycosyltransferase family 4 protein [Petrocella sp. FN5]|uniref:glycosyltransferase family 4 protein n=1 Tax=Petrocella sp. FN5 TaxID=3032002 RepID=UPI0023D97E4B|nr:glycosyltransferase family 4 protein [Petrocella sp. FN5]MDF1616148.1 glycosyltransferase family 4 protein [Petrocella sp. FN5]
MKKILIVSTVSRQFYLFEQGNIEVLKSLGYEVHGAANFEDINERLDKIDIVRHHFDIQRSPFSLKNIKAYKQLKTIMKSENFDAVHCHSPMGSVLARLVARSIKLKNVIYTAHGFHFYKGAPIINWLLYYPIEKWLSRYTDILITINKEDFDRANSFKTCRVEYIPGIGVDSSKFSEDKRIRTKKRSELNIPENSFVILSVGELNRNKNHEAVIRAISKIANKDVLYLICGKGILENYLNDLIQELGLSNQVKLLGFRNDLDEIYQAADLFAFPSYREGLSVSLMEAMASGLPIVASQIRGNVDLIESNDNGLLFKPKNTESCAISIEKIISNSGLRNEMKHRNLITIKKFSKKNVSEKMRDIYKNLL